MVEKQASGEPQSRALVLTDGKMGDRAQCLGVASALGASAKEITVTPGALARMLRQKGRDQAFDDAVQALPSPPDLLIASGRRTIPYVRALRDRWGKDTFSVFLKDPRTGPQTADLIWVPEHDALRGPNVLVTATGPHRYAPHVRADAAPRLIERLAENPPRPWLGVMLGGTTSRVRYDLATQKALLQALQIATSDGANLVITPSRRTPAELLDSLKSQYPSAWIWDETGDNPLAGMLGACDGFFVTGDSHNMVSEALSAGRQTMVFRPAGLPSKFVRFLDGIEAAGHITKPVALDPDHRQSPVDATGIIADRIRQAMADRT